MKNDDMTRARDVWTISSLSLAVLLFSQACVDDAIPTDLQSGRDEDAASARLVL